MEIKSSIFRRGSKGDKTAKSYGNPWTLRFVFVDEDGQRRNKTYQFARRIDAVDARPRIEGDLKKTHGRSAQGEKMTFADLAEYAKANFYKRAVIVEGRKIDGIRSHGRTMTLINTLTEYFDKKRLADITRGDLAAYKTWRIKLGDRRGKAVDLPAKDRKPVRLSSVNRELATMRHMLKNALAEGWITRDVFAGSKAIDADAETARTRTLTDAEEMRLLASCVGTRSFSYKRKGKDVKATVQADNPHLKAIILLGLDSGMRRGEILTLDWKDIDFEAGIIKILGTHTKTQKTRSVPMTSRTKTELRSLPNFGTSGKVFPFSDFKRSWATALKIAKIDGLTFHDLRRTFVTRLQTGGISIGIAAELAGHSRLETTQKHYTSTDNAAVIQDVTAKINAANDARLNLWPDTIE